MDFHHLDPNEKDFGLSGSIKSWEITKRNWISVFWFVKIVTEKYIIKLKKKREKKIKKYK